MATTHRHAHIHTHTNTNPGFRLRPLVVVPSGMCVSSPVNTLGYWLGLSPWHFPRSDIWTLPAVTLKARLLNTQLATYACFWKQPLSPLLMWRKKYLTWSLKSNFVWGIGCHIKSLWAQRPKMAFKRHFVM